MCAGGYVLWEDEEEENEPVVCTDSYSSLDAWRWVSLHEDILRLARALPKRRAVTGGLNVS